MMIPPRLQATDDKKIKKADEAVLRLLSLYAHTNTEGLPFSNNYYTIVHTFYIFIVPLSAL